MRPGPNAPRADAAAISSRFGTEAEDAKSCAVSWDVSVALGGGLIGGRAEVGKHVPTAEKERRDR
jgi:hypothetical protein